MQEHRQELPMQSKPSRRTSSSGTNHHPLVARPMLSSTPAGSDVQQRSHSSCESGLSRRCQLDSRIKRTLLGHGQVMQAMAVVMIVALNAGTAFGQQAPIILKYKPVWQWVNPGLENSGIEWPAGRPEGEVKECTCAYLSYPDNTCIDSASQGRVKSFPCGLGNARRRSGHDELLAGMRPRGPCYCESTDEMYTRDPSNPDDACKAFVTDSSTSDAPVFPATCLPVVYVIEDQWEYIPVSALHDYSSQDLIQPADAYPDPSIKFRTIVDVEWGFLEVFDISTGCDYVCQGGDPNTAGQPCNGAEDTTTCLGGGQCSYSLCEPCGVAGAGACRYPGGTPTPDRIKFEFRSGRLGKHRLTIVGNWLGMQATLLNLKYKPLANQNTDRLRSFFVSQATASSYPYETATYEIFQIDAETGEEELSGDLQQIIRIAAVNDPPVVVNPQDGYEPPPQCALRTEERECHFGQFFAKEDTSETLSIGGMAVSDVDLYEQTPDGKFSVKVIASRGTVDFNTRTDLNFFREFRDRKAFTASFEATRDAIKVLKYRVEIPERVGTVASSVLNYNTQHGGNTEFFDMSFSDQGYSSNDGRALVVETRVDVTIVAVNDPPVVSSESVDFDSVEDTLTDIKGISVSDVDLMEQIESTLALQLWMNDPESRQYLNKIAVEVSVSFGRVYLGVWAKLNIMHDANQEYLSLESWVQGHDLCRVRRTYQNLGAVKFEDVCAHENAGSNDCTTGDISDSTLNPSCRCGVIDRCDTDGFIVLYLNRSKPFQEFRNTLKTAVVSLDRTCGGLPFGAGLNNFSLGRRCVTADDCTPQELPRCVPGQSCYCCANISAVCSADADCQQYAFGSWCGCTRGGTGTCGPYLNSKNGQPVEFDMEALAYPAAIKRTGTPCTYSAQDTAQLPTSLCLPGAFTKTGTQASSVVEALTVNGAGSQTIKFYSGLDDVNRALGAIAYKTQAFYNRLYRPPLDERDINFDITLDSVDELRVTGDDLGNSAGEERDIRLTEASFGILSRAVNNPPSIEAPVRTTVHEDIAMRILQPITHDGTKVVTASFDFTLKVWDLRSGEPVRTIVAHEDVINGVVLTPNDELVVSCSGKFEPRVTDIIDYSVKVHDVATGLFLRKMPLPGSGLNIGHLLGVTCVALNEAGTMVISGGYDYAVILWDIETGKELRHLGGLKDELRTNETVRLESIVGHTDVVTAVGSYSLVEDNSLKQFAVSVSDDHSIRVYSLNEPLGQELHCIGPGPACRRDPGDDDPQAHTGPITALSILNTPQEEFRVLVTASEDMTIKVWELGTFRLLRTLEAYQDHVLSVDTIAASVLSGLSLTARPMLVAVGGHRSPYTKTTFTFSPDTAIRIFDIATGDMLLEIETNTIHLSGKPMTAVRWVSDGSKVVTSAEDKLTVVWDLNTQEVISQAPCPCSCPAVVVADPWGRCQQGPCSASSECPPGDPGHDLAVSGFSLFRNPITIADPDALNYGFDDKPFLLNITAEHGKLYLNEYFLIAERRCTNDNSLCTQNSDCRVGEDQGLCPLPENLNPLVATRDWTNWPLKEGIHAFPQRRFGEGNRALSIAGTMANLNKALTGLRYLADANFNTRYGETASISFAVNDQGALSDNYAKSNQEEQLSGAMTVELIVESVNDSPEIGTLQVRTVDVTNAETGLTVSIDMEVLVPLSMQNIGECYALAPSSPEYHSKCGAFNASLIDVDEDTLFTITSDILWIDDVDADEAITITGLGPRSYACSDPANPDGCTCGRACVCGRALCACSSPDACDEDIVNPGELLIELRVGQGKLSLTPPPGRTRVPHTLYYMTNTEYDNLADCLGNLRTELSVGQQFKDCMLPFDDQENSGVNVSTLVLRITRENLHTVLRQKHLTYISNQDYFGRDQLSVWVSDQGYTDEWYALRRSIQSAARQIIPIRVVGVNDAPVISVPSYVVPYPKGQRCFVDWDENPSGIRCPFDGSFNNLSSVPPLAGAGGELAGNTAPYFTISDVDMDETEFGNLTLNIAVGRLGTGRAGRFTFSSILSTVSLLQYFNHTEKRGYLQVKGRLNDVNFLLRNLFYDSDEDYQGYSPFMLQAFDNNNFGECSGSHACGFGEPCDDHSKSEPHPPPVSGSARALVDVNIGSQVLCAASSCEECTGECGWCHSTCGGKGKCMIGKGSPRFENCPAGGRFPYGSCVAVGTDWATYGAIIGGVGFLVVVLGYMFWRWVQRRHGTVVVYLRKKRADVKRMGRKLHIWPPDSANYMQFYLLAALMAVVFIVTGLLQPKTSAECTFQSEVFLDQAVSLKLELDKCDLRFLPARPENFPSPRDHEVSALKVKFAYTVHPDIALDLDTCAAQARLSVVNDKPIDVRYVDYYCNVVVIVPENSIIPETIIEDTKGFTTRVRAGDMDADSQDFALDFGPNSLTIQGEVINARLRGVQAKRFTYDVVDGELLAEDISTTVAATFRSQKADMVVTTQVRTSVSFWQRSGNKMCLSAPEGSLYVDSSCKELCEFIAPAPVESTNFTLPSTQEECESEEVAGIWDASASPPSCDLQCASLPRPLTPGCYSLEACLPIETPQCLCKPTCDLLPPEELAFGGIAGIAGACNDAGQCCRSVCRGFSRADLFPTAAQPRCGVCEDANLFPWTENNLDQQWTMESDEGQMALQVVAQSSAGEEAAALRHSYQGRAPQESVNTAVNIVTGDKDVLDTLFHPGGANAPKQEWFALLLSGPGTPELSDGRFVFLSNARYLILEPWLLSVLSFGLLTPARGTSSSNLNPAFCPAFTPRSSPLYNQRLIEMYQVLLQTLQEYPPGEPKRLLPYRSFIAYVPVSGTVTLFQTDAQTGEVRSSQLARGDYPLLTMLLLVGILLPFLFSAILAGSLFLRGRNTLIRTRRARLQADALLNSGISGSLKLDTKIEAYERRCEELEEEIRVGKSPGATKKEMQAASKAGLELERAREGMKRARELQEMREGDEVEVTEEEKARVVAQTNFFFMYEDFIGDADAQRSETQQLSLVVQEVLLAVLPTALPLLLSRLFGAEFLAARCEFRPDRCNCLSETHALVTAVQALVFLHWSLALAELSFYYLTVAYHFLRRLTRVVFYLSLFFFLWLSSFIVLILAVWTLLGVLVNPGKAGPYAAAAIGCVLYTGLAFSKENVVRLRIERAVTKEVSERRKAMQKTVPPVVLDVMMGKHIQKALQSRGLSFPAVVLTTLGHTGLLVLVYLFVFIGFNAFSDPNEPAAATLNTVIAIVITLAAVQVSRAVDVAEADELKDDLTKEIMEELNRLLEVIHEQIKLSHLLMSRITGDIGYLGESSDEE